MAETMLKTQGITKRYAGSSSDVLKGVNLSVKSGEYLAIMGKSGSGKSTLLHLIAGLDRPTSGEVWFQDHELSRKNESELAAFRRTQIGFVHQFFNLIDDMTALENVMMPALLIGKGYREMRNRCAELFSQLDITGLENKVPSKLSGGQKQRIAIARALVNQPLVIFADEPTGSLDSQTGEAVLNIFSNLQMNGYSIVMVTHDPKVASQADRIVFMHDGQLTDETILKGENTGKMLMAKVLDIL